MPTTNPIALLAEATRLVFLLSSTLEELRSQLEIPRVQPTGALLERADRRLTEAGIEALYADFAAGTLTDREIATKHQISLSGAVKRKRLWRQGLG